MMLGFLREIWLYRSVPLKILALGKRKRENELASINDSIVGATGELQSHKDELASIRAGEAESWSCFCAPMAATLWSTLPDEALQQIFARLPPPDIIRLQCLSKNWQWNLTSMDSQFKRACAEANPKMFAMVGAGKAAGSVSVNLYDIKANRWHSYVHHFLHYFYPIDKLYAGDGGLVCVVSTNISSKEPLITVLNPLDPGRSRVLPCHGLRVLQMVQLVMDRDRRCYNVLVVGKKNGAVVAKIFSSETGAWDGEILEGLVFGHEIIWKYGKVHDDRVGPCAYDSVGRELLVLNDGSHPCDDRRYVHFGYSESSSLCYALVRDHMFVLHEETYDEVTYKSERYCISEYRGQKCEPHWVKLKVHRCKEFERPPTDVSYRMSLYACKGFLLVKADNEEPEPYRHVLTWLYDLATERWQVVPPLAASPLPPWSDAMFELQWDAIA